MITLEQVEKLRDRTGVSWEEAKKALEETNGDLLEAVINLEKQNRIKPPLTGGYYHSQADGQQTNQGSSQTSHDKKSHGSSFRESMEQFLKWAGRVLHKGNTNNFKVTRYSEKIMAIPLTAMVLLLIFAFYIVIPLVIVGMFFGYRYGFEGPEINNPSVNRVMDSVANAAENLKKDIANGMNDNPKDE